MAKGWGRFTQQLCDQFVAIDHNRIGWEETEYLNDNF